MPSLVLLLVIDGWQAYVTLAEVPHYILPSPLRVTVILLADWPILRPALLITGRLTLLALILISVMGVVIFAMMSLLSHLCLFRWHALGICWIWWPEPGSMW